MQLSNRLKAVAGLIVNGKRLADVGTDHGYVPIYLIQKGVIDHALAMDIRKGPLERASEHIRQYGLEAYIETCLSDGVSRLQPGEADCMVIAGMGGILTIHILEQGAAVTARMCECVLQPQSEIARVRKYLWQHDFMIEEEDMVLEDGKFYPMMRVIPGKKQEIAEDQWELCARYGPCLLKQRHPVLQQMLQREECMNRQLQRQLISKLPHTRERLAQLKAESELIRQALAIVAPEG